MKSTSSLLVSPFEGKGHSIVDGKRFDWNAVRHARRSPAAPGSSTITTSAKEPLFLFVASDEPTLKKLDLYKKWGKSVSGEITQFAA